MKDFLTATFKVSGTKATVVGRTRDGKTLIVEFDDGSVTYVSNMDDVELHVSETLPKDAADLRWALSILRDNYNHLLQLRTVA